MSLRSLLVFPLAVVASLAAQATTYVYDVTMYLTVPRVYDNMESQGYRKYQCQTVRGVMRVTDDEFEPVVEMSLTNRTHKVGGSSVTYECYVSDVRFHLIGSNRTGKFTKPSVAMSLMAEPSYNIGELDEDNTLMVTLAGRGTSYKYIHGYVAGSLGCGCYAYGHVSPTRIFGSCAVVDTAAVMGSWRARLRKTEE